APIITTNDSTFAYEDSLYYVDYNAYDEDGDPLTWHLNTNASWLSINPTTGELYGTPTQYDVGQYWVNISVSDNNDGYDFHNFTLTVINVNDAPIITTNDTTIAYEDQLYYVDYNAYDEDGDTLTWHLISNASWLSINPTTGELSGTPTQSDVSQYWVNISVADGLGGLSYHNFILSVVNANDPPIILTSDVTTAYEDSEYRVQYSAYDEDNDISAWSFLTNASWLNFDIYSHTLYGVPLQHDVGTYWVNISVFDVHGSYDFHNFTLTVLNVNDAPVISPIDDQEVYEDSNFTYQVLAFDEDGDEITYWIDEGPEGMMIGGGGIIKWTPEQKDVGTWRVVVGATDGTACSYESFNITVINVNDPPTASITTYYMADYINISVSIAGTPGSSVSLKIMNKSREVIDEIYVVRTTGKPNTARTSVSLNYTQDYIIMLTYFALEAKGCSNPVKLTFEYHGVVYTEHFVFGKNAYMGEVLLSNVFARMGIVTYDASKSYDDDGDNLTYHWVFDDGTEFYGCVVTKVYSDLSAHKTVLYVVDEHGAMAKDECVVYFLSGSPENYVTNNPLALEYLKSSNSIAIILECPTHMIVVDGSGGVTYANDGVAFENGNASIAYNIADFEVYYAPADDNITCSVVGDGAGEYSVCIVMSDEEIVKISSTIIGGEVDKVRVSGSSVVYETERDKSYDIIARNSHAVFSITNAHIAQGAVHEYTFNDCYVHTAVNDGTRTVEKDMDYGNYNGYVLYAPSPLAERGGAAIISASMVVIALGLVALTSLGFALFTSIEPLKWALVSSLVLPLYSRIHKSTVLDYYVRGKIYGYLLANPGEHYNAIKEALGLSNGSLSYHLTVLERNGLIKSVVDGKYRRFYPATVKIPDNGFRRKTAIQERIINILRQLPGASQKDVAKLLGVSPPAVHYQMERLLEMGVIKKVRRGIRVGYYVVEEE
ncbi:MAG: hypothetical protein DRN20_02165, partial [Thermoplasmata archaeon]